jgi:hypothetical protein
MTFTRYISTTLSINSCMNDVILSLCWISTLTGSYLGLEDILHLCALGLGDILLLRKLFLLDPVDLNYEAYVSGSRESTYSKSESDRLVDCTVCLSFLGLTFVLTFLGGGRIKAVSNKTNCSLICPFML